MNLEGSAPARDIPSTKHVVFESLRLYPPTRRIHRAYQWSDSAADDNQEPKAYDDMAADIEACHLRSDIWGPYALVFNPERWKQPTSRQQEAFMPFGHKPFQCPAQSVFGPRMIGILVGALLEALTSETINEWKLESVDQGVVDEMLCGRRLEMDRNAYENVDLVGYRAEVMDEDTWTAGCVD
jgi:cytochrome P450